MTTQIAVKLINRPTVKASVLPRFPANVTVAEFLTVARANGKYTFGIDFTLIATGVISDPTTAMFVVLDETTGSYRLVSAASVLASALAIDQHITAAGPVAINNNSGIVRVDQTVGAPITLNMPLSSAKTCPVLICDWKGDAGTNAITISLQGSDKFPGGLTSWTLNADTASVRLSPISGVGYTVE